MLLDVPELPTAFVAELTEQIPRVAESTVAAVAAQVPGFAAAARDPYRAELRAGVRMAFTGFAALLDHTDAAGPDRIASGARALGRTEARRRRGIEALLSAYQVGTAVHWQEIAVLALRHGLSAATMSALAALVFDYNQRLTAASVEGYTAETRTRERDREALAAALLAGAPTDALRRRAGWTPPATLTCVLIGRGSATSLLAAYPDSLQTPVADSIAVLVPDAARPALLATAAGLDAVVGPSVTWPDVAASLARAQAVAELVDLRPADSEAHLLELVLTGTALTDLRAQVLAPLAGNDRLIDTLRAWLLHVGRRDAVAASLVVHPQTVRYRMQQIRQRYGDRLNDPHEVLNLVVALGPDPRDRR